MARRGFVPEYVVQPGELVHQGTLQRPTLERRTSGSFDRVWEDVATVRFAIEAGSGKEFEAAGTVSGISDYRVTMRWISGVDTTMRLLFNGRKFDIIDINNVQERNRKLILICREGRSQGS